MSLVQETGAGLATSNSYVAVADADAYFSRHSVAAKWAPLANDAKETALITAARALDYGVTWKGLRVTAEQAMQWPRKCVKISTGLVEEDVVPAQVKMAQMEIAALVVVGGDRMADPSTAGLKSAVLGKGALEVEFDSSTTRTLLGTAAPLMLQEFTVNSAAKTSFVRTQRV